jgi:hypothetical protein
VRAVLIRAIHVLWWENLTMVHHFVNLLLSCVHIFASTIGTNPLGFALMLMDSLASIGVSLFRILRREGVTAMREHWRQTAWITLQTVFWVTLVLYGPVAIYSVVHSVYDDHQFQVSANAKLLAANIDLAARLKDTQDNAEQRCEQAKGKEIKRLQRQLNAACFRPDRHLTPEDHAVIFATLQRITDEQKKKNLVPSVRVIGGWQDNEVSRFWNDELWPIFRNAGWTQRTDVPSEKLTTDQINKNFEFQRAWIYQSGFAEGISVFDKDAKGFGWGLSMPFYERGYGSMWDQRHTELPNVDGLTIWVGYKVVAK